MADLKDFGFPFNSVGTDRQYNASVFRNYFNGLYVNGVIPDVDNEVEITELDTPAKSVKVNTGFVLVEGVMYNVDVFETIVISDNASGNPRIDRIVARLDYTNRLMEVDVLEGTPATSPAIPPLTQTSVTYEIPLAQVYLANGYTTITDSIITDERAYSRTTSQDRFEQENNFSQYNKDVITVDANNLPTQVDYDRDDTTLAIRQVASNPDVNGYYQTIVETYYGDDGSTVYKTITYTLIFLSNGIIDQSSRVVVAS